MIIAMPTKNGILLLLASLAAVGTAIMNVGFATAMIASLLCALTISCFIMAQFSLHGITITRDRTHDAVCGGTPTARHRGQQDLSLPYAGRRQRETSVLPRRLS